MINEILNALKTCKEQIKLDEQVTKTFNALSDDQKDTAINILNRLGAMFNVSSDWTREDFEPKTTTDKDLADNESDEETTSNPKISIFVVNGDNEICEKSSKLAEKIGKVFVDSCYAEYDTRKDDKENDTYVNVEPSVENSTTSTTSLYESLIEEINNLPPTEDEIADNVVSFIMDSLNDKVRKPYILHRATASSRPAVEVLLKNDVDYNNLLNPYISEKIKKDVTEKVPGISDVIICKASGDTEGTSVYITL